MNVKVSIIIPVYNVAPYLDACLSSCINQTFQDIEIIVVNDGSPDTSYQIIAAYAAMDDRIVVINKENEGLIYARKSGLDIARGEYVYHLDGDDYIEHNAIEQLYNEAIEKDSDYVMASYFDIWKNCKQKNLLVKEGNGLSGQDLLAFLINNDKWQIWGKLIRKELFDGIVYRNVFMGEDLYINMQITLKVKNAAVVEACLYNYVKREDSVTNKNDDNKLELELVMVNSIWFLFDTYSYEQRIKECIYDYLFNLFSKSIRGDKRGIKKTLRCCCWNRNDIRTYLWKKRKVFCVIFAGYLYAPKVTSLGVRLGYRLKLL